MHSARFLEMRREALGFVIGSMCFALGSLPWYFDTFGAVATNATFFVGSLFFTTAGLIQLLLSGRRPPRSGGSRADLYDWWSAAVQSVGTLLFNVSTAAALIAAIRTPDAVGVGWRSDAWGSAAFLASGIIALGALRRRHELWDFFARSPGAVWLGMAGSVAFGVSAIGAYVLPATDTVANERWAAVGTFVGAVCFLVAAFMTRPGVTERDPAPASGNAAT